MEQEKWIQQINWINQLKLRVGYGVTGNSAVNPYQTAGSVTSTYASIPLEWAMFRRILLVQRLILCLTIL